jgi:hypothetical protein
VSFYPRSLGTFRDVSLGKADFAEEVASLFFFKRQKVVVSWEIWVHILYKPQRFIIRIVFCQPLNETFFRGLNIS